MLEASADIVDILLLYLFILLTTGINRLRDKGSEDRHNKELKCQLKVRVAASPHLPWCQTLWSHEVTGSQPGLMRSLPLSTSEHFHHQPPSSVTVKLLCVQTRTAFDCTSRINTTLAALSDDCLYGTDAAFCHQFSSACVFCYSLNTVTRCIHGSRCRIYKYLKVFSSESFRNIPLGLMAWVVVVVTRATTKVRWYK